MNRDANEDVEREDPRAERAEDQKSQRAVDPWGYSYAEALTADPYRTW